MTADVEGLPTGARDRLAEALPDELGPVGLAHRAVPQLGVAREVSGYGNQLLDALLPVVADLCAEARADELRATADALHVQRFDVEDGQRSVPDSFYAGIVRARTELRTRADQQHRSSPDCWCKPIADGIGWRHR